MRHHSESRGAARRRLAARFAAAGLDSPDLDARLLVCAAASIDHAGFIRDPDLPLTPAQHEILAGFATRRLAREPVSRILGHRAFWGLDLAVTPAVLDPRPETEGLVGAVIDAIGGRRADALDILDLGTGSGAILAALLTELPSAHGMGIDRSLAACRVARQNLAAVGVGARAQIVCSDWTAPVAGRFDAIVANPPYIASGDLAALSTEVRAYDPQAALDGGADGYGPYRTIIPGVPTLLKPGGVAVFECGAGQGETIARLMRAAGLGGVAVYRDLAGHERVVIGLAAGNADHADHAELCVFTEGKAET